jgi:hypothetical protein
MAGLSATYTLTDKIRNVVIRTGTLVSDGTDNFQYISDVTFAKVAGVGRIEVKWEATVGIGVRRQVVTRFSPIKEPMCPEFNEFQDEFTAGGSFWDCDCDEPVPPGGSPCTGCC